MFKRARLSSEPGAAAQPSEEQVSLGSYTTYTEAQSVVDRLADVPFEVETPQIVRGDLRLQVHVVGRLTWVRTLLAGIAGGAWFGMLVGLLLTRLSATAFLPAMAWGFTCGAVFGGAFAAAGFGLTRKRRGFISVSSTAPSRFDILVAPMDGERARELAGKRQ
jgi:hypothetical protein